MSRSAVSIAVLAGGRSSRLGFDKALATLTEGGPPLLGLAIERVHGLTDDLFIVSEQRLGYDTFGVPVVPDRRGGAGPLEGIATALRTAKHDRCLIVSCDHPFLDRGLLSAMIEDRDEWEILVPTLPGESRQGDGVIRQTLHAIYRTTLLPAIERRLDEGRRQVVGVFAGAVVKELDIAWIRQFDPDFLSFLSVNTPESMEAARRIARSLAIDRGVDS